MIISLSIGILSRLTAVSRFHLQSMKKKCSEKSGWDKEKEVARRTRGETLEKTKEGEGREREREREGEEFASKQAKFQKSSKKPEAVGCCYAATIDHLGGRRRDS